MPKKRDDYFDQLRGVAIIAVVAIHITSVIIDKNFANTFNFSFLFIYRQLLNFAIPLFLFVSGYFMAKKDVSTVEKYKSFILKQAKKILIPYAIFTSMFILIDYYNGESITLKSVTLNFLTGNVVSPYFFIILIFQYYLLLPLLQKINNIKGLIISIVINILYFVALYIYRINLTQDIPNLYYALIFPAWLFFYQYGLYLGKYGLTKKSAIWLWLLPLSVILIFIESMLWLKEKHLVSFAISQLRISSFIYSFVLINILVSYRFFNLKFLSKIGLVSFGIYLTHMFLLIYLVLPLTTKTLIYDIQPLYQILILFSIILINYYVINLMEKILPKKLNQLLGFA